MSAFENNEYVERANIGQILFSPGETAPDLNITDVSNSPARSRSRTLVSNETVAAVAEFTAILDVNVTAGSGDIESSITNSFTAFTNSSDISTATMVEISEKVSNEVQKHNGKFKISDK